jgi:hypothetical protein
VSPRYVSSQSPQYVLRLTRLFQVEGEKKDPRELADRHGLILNISHSVLEGSPGAERLSVEVHPDVIAQIIANASPAQGTGP